MVLYIEDNPANTLVVQEALNRSENFEFQSAPTAEEGLILAEENIPDIILMGITLPDIDGYAALKILRNVVETHDIPVIAVSSNAMDVDIQSGIKAGFDEYLTKPINIEKLYDVICKHTRTSASN